MQIIIDELKVNKVKLLTSVDLNINNGEIIHIIGKNGAGKSTLFKAILGKIDYKGKIDINPLRVSIVSDYAKLPNELYVRDIVNFLKKLHKNHDSNKTKKLEEIIGVNKLYKRKISQLSSGESRKVEIFSTMFSDKKVVIFDELTNALDEESKNKTLELVNSIRKNYTDLIIFYTTHDINEIKKLGGRTFFINQKTKTLYEKTFINDNDIMVEYMSL